MTCGRIVLAAVAGLLLAGMSLAQTTEPARQGSPGGPADAPVAVAPESKPATPAEASRALRPADASSAAVALPEAAADPAVTAIATPEPEAKPEVRRRAPARRPARTSPVRRTPEKSPEPSASPTTAAASALKPVVAPTVKPAPPKPATPEARPFLTEYQDPKQATEMPLGRLIVDLFVKLAIVLAIGYGALYILRGFMSRQGVVPGRRGGHLRVLESASLGPNRSVHLVRVGGKVMVVGSTPEQVTSLGEVNDSETLALLTAESAGSFPAQLSGAMTRDGVAAPAEDAPLAAQVRGSVRHVWDQVQEIRGLRGRGGGR